MAGSVLEGRFKRENLSEIVIEYIKEQIITGRYEEGDHIPETEIANELGISRAPVREGIRELQNMGIIEFIPRKGNYVSAFTDEDKKEIFDIRLLLEGDMIELIIKENKLRDDDFKYLASIVDEMLHISMADGDMMKKAVALSKKDIEFHKYIWDRSGSKRRAEILEKLHFQLQMAMIYDTKLSGDLQMTAKEHYEIIEYLKLGDIQSCKNALRGHIVSYRDGVF